MSRSYSDRVRRFRRGVYGKRPGLTMGCRVLLLRLADDMDAKCIVSIPRSKLAAEFGVAPARITEWVTLAKDLGFLSTVRRGRPGVTATYQGLIVGPVGTESVPLEVREGVPSQRYGKPDVTEVREGVPQNGPTWYARAGSQVVVPSGTFGTGPSPQRNAATKRSEPCEWCHATGCPQCIPLESETA